MDSPSSTLIMSTVKWLQTGSQWNIHTHLNYSFVLEWGNMAFFRKVTCSIHFHVSKAHVYLLFGKKHSQEYWFNI